MSRTGLSWAVLVAGLLVNNAAGSVLPKARSSISGGDTAPDDSWPWMALLFITDGIGPEICTGSLISDEWVLTAADALDLEGRTPVPGFSFARLGTNNLEDRSEAYVGLSEFIVHPKRDKNSNNIALVRLEKKVAFTSSISPVTLPARGQAFGPLAECWITGWGDFFYSYPPYYMEQLELPIIKRRVCKDMVDERPSNIICAGKKSGFRIGEKTDIGGPLVCQSSAGFVLTGVTVGVMSDFFEEPYQGVFSRVTHYLDFINDTIENAQKKTSAHI